MFAISQSVLGLLIASLSLLHTTHAGSVDHSSLVSFQRTEIGDSVFKLGDVTYLAHLQRPKIAYRSKGTGSVPNLIPVTVIRSQDKMITGKFIESTLASYAKGDDVFSNAFLDGLLISSAFNKAKLDTSAVQYLKSIKVSYLFLDSSISSPHSISKTTVVVLGNGSTKTATKSLPLGPYVAELGSNSVTISSVSRLYEDTHRDFLFGVYSTESGEGDYTGLGAFNPNTWFPYIPVPSRIYSWGDKRPLAGERVAIKDLYDLKGVQTSGGSTSYAAITPFADETAPSIQRIIDLGGVIVGKQKLAQFASGANVWQWQDQHYPWNPRGDGWLTCSASSAGGGCSLAGYDWLDFAIGSDTGSSMRRPAAVAGVYGQRPSQGLMTLEKVIPLTSNRDTAGVFSRDPYKWIKFSKAWYTKELEQDTSITGLSPLVTPDTNAFPKRILYAVDYLPLSNPAAETILQAFIANLTRVFDMKVENFNMSLALANYSSPLAKDYSALSRSGSTISTKSTYEGYAQRLISTWAELNDGRYPPVDPDWRHSWDRAANLTEESYTIGMKAKKEGVDWYEKHIQFSTEESCSESVMLYDIGTGGKPSYREEHLNDSPDASYLAANFPYNTIARAGICPLFGCADFTIPIGQVPYYSNVTFHEEMVPVTINMVVKRGCDFVLMNMVKKLTDEGVLQTVKTGRTPF